MTALSGAFDNVSGRSTGYMAKMTRASWFSRTERTSTARSRRRWQPLQTNGGKASRRRRRATAVGDYQS